MGIHSCLESCLSVFLERIGGHGNDRDARLGFIFQRADGVGGIIAIHARHLDIHQNTVVRVRIAILYPFNASLAISHTIDLDVISLQNLDGYLGIEVIVFGK